MDILISLIDLLNRQKLRQVSVVDELDNTSNQLSVLYSLINSGKINSDHDASMLIYNKNKNATSLKRLKNRLYHKLINSVFFIDQTSNLYSDIQTAAKTCYKNYAAVKILIGNKKRDVAIDLALRTYTISKKFEFTDLNYLLSSFLTTHYSAHTLNKKRYYQFKADKQYYQEALISENNLEEMQSEFNIRLSSSSTLLSPEEIKLYERNISDILELQKRVKTYRFNLFAYLYRINLLLEINKYDMILDLVDEGIRFFKNKGIESKNIDFLLRMRGGIASFMLRDFKTAEMYFSQNLAISDPLGTNWYSTSNLLVSMSISTRDYSTAYSLISKIFSAGKIEDTHPLLVQQFKIKEAYIHFLIKLGKIDPSDSNEKPLRKFRLNRFLNDVPTYSKDKRGVNISILIIQMLLLVQNKKHGEIIDKMDALNMYSYRYLRGDNTFRSNCFIKMLTKLPDADYHPIRWQRYVKKFRQRLDEQPFELSYHNLDLEVIPFETLYDLVVEMLEQQQGRKRRS